MEIKHKLKNGFVLIGCLSPKRKSRRRRNKDTTETETQEPAIQKNTAPTPTAEPAPLQQQNWAQLAKQTKQKQANTNILSTKKSKKSARRLRKYQKNTKTVETPPALIRKIPPPALTRRIPTRLNSKGGFKARRIVHTYDEKDVDMTRKQLSFPTLAEADKVTKSSLRKAGGFRAARVATAYDPNYDPTEGDRKYSNFSNNSFNNSNSFNSRNYGSYSNNNNFNRNYSGFNNNNFNRNNSYNTSSNNISRPTNNISRPTTNNSNGDNVTRSNGLSSRARGFRAKRVPSDSVRPSYTSSNVSSKPPPNAGFRDRPPNRTIIRRPAPKTPPQPKPTPPQRMNPRPKPSSAPSKRNNSPPPPRMNTRPPPNNTPPQRRNTRPKPNSAPPKRSKSPPQRRNTRPPPNNSPPPQRMNPRPPPSNTPPQRRNTRPKPNSAPSKRNNSPQRMNTRPPPSNTPPQRMKTPPKRTVTETPPNRKSANNWNDIDEQDTQLENQSKSLPKPKRKHKRKARQRRQSIPPRSARKNLIAALDQNEKTKKYLEMRKLGSLSYLQNTFVIKKSDSLHEVASIKRELAKQISCNERELAKHASNDYYYNKNDMLHYVSNKDFDALNDTSVNVTISPQKIKSSAESFNPRRKNISVATTNLPNISRATSAPTPTATYNNMLPNVYTQPTMTQPEVDIFENARRAASAAATQQALNQQFTFVTTAPTQPLTPITPQSINHFGTGSQPMLQFGNMQNQNQTTWPNELDLFEQQLHIHNYNENNLSYDVYNNENNIFENGVFENDNYGEEGEDEDSYENGNGYNGYGRKRRWNGGRNRNYYSNKWNRYKSNRYKKSWYNWNKNKNKEYAKSDEEINEETHVFVHEKRLDFRVLPKWCQHNNITTLFRCVDGFGFGYGDLSDIERESEEGTGEERESELLDENLYFNFLCSAESDSVYEYLGFKEIIISQIYFLNKSIRKRVHDTAPLLLQTYCFL